jgi:hypothetical protein
MAEVFSFFNNIAVQHWQKQVKRIKGKVNSMKSRVVDNPSKDTPTAKSAADDVAKDLLSETADSEEDDDDDDDEEELLDAPGNTKKYILIGVIAVLVITLFIFIYVITRPKPAEIPPLPTPTPTPDPALVLRDELYKQGIGKEFVNEQNIYEQGNMEPNEFRIDFTGIGQPEKFTLPIKIMSVNDTVAYTKHRAQTGNGVEIYWLEGEYQGRKCVFTVKYSIYEIIADSGTIDVVVEVVTDATGSKTITNFEAKPPAQYTRSTK